VAAELMMVGTDMSGDIDPGDEDSKRLQRALSSIEKHVKPSSAKKSRTPLVAERHPTLDFFVCNILDAAPKDDLGSMEHPMFSLATKPDMRIRRYEHNGNSITIAPGAYGMATIWDKDILIYCASQIIAALNRDDPVSRTVRVTAHDILVATNRGTDGRAYEQLRAALERLAGTRITTNIVTGRVRERRGFGLIDSWLAVEKEPNDGRMIAMEITPSEWFYRAVVSREVLTISRDYFRLRGGLERRLYEIARKHCGGQREWTIGLVMLHKKSGSSATLKEFRRKIKSIATTDHLPDYGILFQEDTDSVQFVLESAA
jgi:plasmid replication initiation protein